VYELADEIAMMVRAVRDGAPVAATADDGRRAVALCRAAQRSVATGAVVQMGNF
jgi:predicted dehydrogenase